jgi:hypothetical protein
MLIRSIAERDPYAIEVVSCIGCDVNAGITVQSGKTAAEIAVVELQREERPHGLLRAVPGALEGIGRARPALVDEDDIAPTLQGREAVAEHSRAVACRKTGSADQKEDGVRL